MSTTASFIGGGTLLIASAQHWLDRGHRVRGVVTDCPIAGAWAKARELPLHALSAEYAGWLGAEPFDYLFSVVNHVITPARVLALPTRRAINYHDSPLPLYGGFNATSWAIIEGRREHGVTWHEMSATVDAGDILLQQSVVIEEDDTAFTLGTKCLEAGLESFRDLVALLEGEVATGVRLSGEPQGPQQGFHLRSDRPGQGIIDLSLPASQISALVRGLDHGTDDNWMCRPKLALQSAAVIVGEASVAEGLGSPGQVLAIDAQSVTVAVGEGAVRFSGLTTLEGAALDCSSLGFDVGDRLHSTAAAGLGAAAFDKGVTRHERFWVRRLVNQQAAEVAGALPRVGRPKGELRRRPAPPVLKGQSAEACRSALVAALAAYVARTGDDVRFDLALIKDQPVEVAGLYAASTPFRLAVDLTRGFDVLRTAVEAEIEVQDRRGVYARDAVTRYKALRERPPVSLSLGVKFVERIDDATAQDAVERAALVLAVGSRDGEHAWAYDRNALSPDVVDALADRVEVLLAAGLADDDAPIGQLDILQPAERDMILGEWQRTGAPYAEACIQDLFAAQVARTPDAVALVFENTSLTYRDLDGRANAMAHALRGLGVGPEVLVGVCVERSIEMVVALLGVLKAGGAYVPLDPAYPTERLSVMIEDSKAKVLVSQRRLLDRLPVHDATVFCVEDLGEDTRETAPDGGATPENLAYVIFTSGSTGRPKGVMIPHRSVSNFFTGMDEAIGPERGVWLAVTSISFDISVLELWWTLTRGFEVVVQGESDRASLSRDAASEGEATMDLSLFYFAAEQQSASGAYDLLIEGAKFADTHGFSAVWTPERHFHAFGGLYPNPAITSAALATITSRIALRAGSVVLPLHDPLRVAEDWAVVDQLSNGRVGLSFASGWHADDFAFMPENYERRREVMLEHIDAVRQLWDGGKIERTNGAGQTISVGVLPRPVQPEPPMWIAAAGSLDTFKLAGRLGANILTNMLGQNLADLKVKFQAYREARREAGHTGQGGISVMLHTFVCEDTERARELARKPFCEYLASSFDLIKAAPSMFPAFKPPSRDAGSLDTSGLTDGDMEALLDYAFDRYFETAGLFGAPERALAMVERLQAIGATEIACLVDFGIDPKVVLDNLKHLDALRRLTVATGAASRDGGNYGIVQQIAARGVTHLQCTPSMARILAGDAEGLAALGGLKRLLLGGEALPNDLKDILTPVLPEGVINMYGPTETTIWSTTSPIKHGEPITIGRPISNTVIRILDPRGRAVPIGVAGELCIGGLGVARGYLGRDDLTAERFIGDPYAQGATIYRTGDLARYRSDGEIEFIGRLDHQVKVNGYRIELGEIETQLGRHPSVRENVVVVRTDGGAAQLVGYVVPSGVEGGGGEEDRVDQWRTLWDDAYRQVEAPTRPRFNIAGWNSSYDGAPIPAEEMREWLDGVERAVAALHPRRVLEIGCGTGMVLYRLLPHVEHYTAIDVSPHAIETIRGELTPAEREKVTLLCQPAHALQNIAEKSVDVVIINSVAQYFPDETYLTEVLKQAAALVSEGGSIFVGDVRSRDHADAFHAVAALNQAPAGVSGAEVAERIERRIDQDGELVLSEAFFHDAVRTLDRITGVDARLKYASASNEMTDFRYDVVLRVGGAPAPVAPAPADVAPDLDAIRQALASSPPVLLAAGLCNSRVSRPYAALEAIASNPAIRVETLRELLSGEADGVDPQALFDLHPDYDAEVFWARSGEVGKFDVLLRHKSTGPRGRLALPAPPPVAERRPRVSARSKIDVEEAKLIAELRAHLRTALPEYMIPSAFVVLDELPLTPNGKVDRKALPPPGRESRPTTTEYVAPTSSLEETIATVWKGLLGVSRVGRKDNIFDLGANSLLTAQANQRLASQLDRKISLVSMFRYPTVEALAAHLGEGAAPSSQLIDLNQLRVERKRKTVQRRRELRAEMSLT